MADMTAVVGLISGLGAAVIGAAGGSLLQRSRHKQESAAVAAERAETERERERLAKQVALEIATSARTANHAMLTAMGRIQQDAEAGRPVDASRFDEEVGSLEAVLVASLHRLAASGAAVVPTTSSSGDQRPYAAVIAEVAGTMRKHLLSIADGTGSGAGDLASALQAARVVSEDLNRFLLAQTELIIEKPVGFRMAVDVI
ncbi:hypothetical protein [Streptomyces sp. CBMA123]|uniref:hypothetical protein n=1 Tax=Streptomyces sp. CBMA123 TaxID=1896313 RepID=UPI001661C2EC|nr:hypothetical protein [Streptomyces sp. CBMA123]MBD0692557.1 hypothetical protein [Streptomyces sp. CBMA123]